MKTEILYEDRDILVIYKPAGLATQTAKVGQQDVVSELRNYLRRSPKHSNMSCEQSVNHGQSVPYLGIIHRLDQPVEGLLVFAKNKKAAASLTGQLQKQGDGQMLCKHYYAVICGRPAKKEGELVDYLYKNQENRAVIVEQPLKAQAQLPGQKKYPEARRAALHYRILQTDDARGIALADIHILTGRFHQIRAQMAHAGMPLLADMKYGNEEAVNKAQVLGIRNVALCASRLEFIHPVSKEKMNFQIKPKGRAFSCFSQL